MATDAFPDLTQALQQARRASDDLMRFKAADRSRVLQVMAQVLADRQDDILEANTLDLEASREMAVADLILDWLKLTPERLQASVALLERLADLPDPMQQVLSPPHVVNDCQTYVQVVPLGVIALIYEALPELSAIATGLCLRTGNSLVLKGTSEASHSNQAIVAALQSAIADVGFPEGCLTLLPSDQGGSVRELVVQDTWLNLIIPYGRPSLVQQVVRQATAPVLRSAMGNCYLYWAPSGSLDAARSTILDSHRSEPDPVNAIEKVLIHRSHNPSTLTMLWNALKEKGFELRGDAELAQDFPVLALAEPTEWNQAYLDRTIAFKVVDSMGDAIHWINTYSSGHADCLVTESYQDSRQFGQGLQSASVYINASPRFHRNPVRGNAIALGMSNQRGHRRGLISLDTLTTTKHVVQGNE